MKKYKPKLWFLIFIIFQGIGAVLGSLILVKIDPNLLRIIFITAIVLLVLKNLLIKDLKHYEKGFKETNKNILLLSLAAIFLGMYNAAFVIGDWIIALLILTNLFSFKYHKAIFLLTFTSIFSQPIAVHQYYVNGLIDFNFLIPMLSATFIGGIISAIILDKIHSKKLETFLKYLSILLVLYLIIGIFTPS